MCDGPVLNRTTKKSLLARALTERPPVLIQIVRQRKQIPKTKQKSPKSFSAATQKKYQNIPQNQKTKTPKNKTKTKSQ
jgi:hypothetical protein